MIIISHQCQFFLCILFKCKYDSVVLWVFCGLYYFLVYSILYLECLFFLMKNKIKNKIIIYARPFLNKNFTSNNVYILSVFQKSSLLGDWFYFFFFLISPSLKFPIFQKTHYQAFFFIFGSYDLANKSHAISWSQKSSRIPAYNQVSLVFQFKSNIDYCHQVRQSGICCYYSFVFFWVNIL